MPPRERPRTKPGELEPMLAPRLLLTTGSLLGRSGHPSHDPDVGGPLRCVGCSRRGGRLRCLGRARLLSGATPLAGGIRSTDLVGGNPECALLASRGWSYLAPMPPSLLICPLGPALLLQLPFGSCRLPRRSSRPVRWLRPFTPGHIKFGSSPGLLARFARWRMPPSSPTCLSALECIRCFLVSI